MNPALWLEAVHFQRPLWLWALLLAPLPWLLGRRRRGRGWREVVDPHLLPHLLEPAGAGAGPRLAGVGLALALAALALSGPGWRQQAQPQWQAQAPLVIALDLSSAIATPDLPPSRLAQARAKLALLLRERRGGEVGLVAWAEDAYTVAPLTADAGNIGLFLESLAPEVMPVDGARPERALTHAAGLLRQAGFAQGQILLLTGEADEASRRIAAALAAQGYRTSVLGLGSAAGAVYRDREGGTRRARLDETSLRALAAAGGGRYARLTVDAGDLRALGVLDPPASDGQARGEGERTWLDQGYWLLLPLALLAALAFRRGAGVLAAWPLALLLGLGAVAAPPARAAGQAAQPPTPVRAAAATTQGARSWWQRPDQQAQRTLEQGVDAYRGGDFAAAAQAFDAAAARGAEAQYNLGNALARQGRYDDAIAAYDRALAQAPGMEDAIANRAVVEAARKRQPPSGGGQGQSRDPGEGQPPQEGDDGTPPPQAGQPSSDAQGTPSSGRQSPPQPSSQQQPPSSSAAPPPQADDAQARSRQEQADREQRERMRQALQQNDPGTDPAQVQEDPADARTREQVQAHEAWLRRVPDDPGGLLRAKFRLEHERRQREGR
ncbi:hypothetical protein CSC62_04930 [Pseudoxanthomonas jiangsuensis]|uniref:tetratricopeptide repeat protein n=1 Tax=Pseudoxanthomonas jiangsuensis TaxID=619688 RepID=UPI001391E182|nr:tetratricopeptide repeat protein [Pseudoxanthomonas jiangsuensis]KAF1698614.1 hypothetical protein CSC62_04930 [Pseudoxanthomonas jiangsuensis]